MEKENIERRIIELDVNSNKLLLHIMEYFREKRLSLNETVCVFIYAVAKHIHVISRASGIDANVISEIVIGGIRKYFEYGGDEMIDIAVDKKDQTQDTSN